MGFGVVVSEIFETLFNSGRLSRRSSPTFQPVLVMAIPSDVLGVQDHEDSGLELDDVVEDADAL